MFPHLLQHLSPAFQPVHPVHYITAHLTLGSLLEKWGAVNSTIKAFTQQKVSYDCMYPSMNISSVSLVLISFKTQRKTANQESFSWVPYCFAVLTASFSGGKLFLSNLCSCWFIQSLLYLDSCACSLGWLSHNESAPLLCSELAPCLKGKDHTLPVALCSMDWHRRWWQATGQGQVKRWQRADWNSGFLYRSGEYWKSMTSLESSKSFLSQYEPKWDECLVRAVNKERTYSCMKPLATVCLHFLFVF